VLLTAGRAATASLWPELLIVAALFGATAWVSARMQDVTVTRYWDGDEYYVMTEQIAAGETPRAAAPYVYRLATPWLVAHLSPRAIVNGYRAINLTAAAVTAAMLLVWLRRFVAERWARLLAVTLFIVEWHGPVRFVFYYPVYVDPLVFPFLIAGLLLIDSLRSRSEHAITRLVALTAICVVGALTREVMIVVPIALLVARHPIGRAPSTGGARAPELLWWLPLAATVATLAATRIVTQPRLAFSFVGTALFHVRNKPFYTWLLAWFITFGPVLALVFDDWRSAWRGLTERQDLAVYLALFGVLAYIGGHDTERYLFWSMPVVYVLIAQALVSHRAALSHTYLASALIVAQAVSERIFWGIPSPSLATATLEEMPSRAARAYAILNRLVVVDDFHWNLWSNFGSRSFHALLLAIYVAFSAAVIAWLRLRAVRLRPLSPASA
jgi:hypothetical protein